MDEARMAGLEGTVLISGASFAGLATAWWMHRLGFQVTVVEIAPGLKKGGTPVDIREGVVDVVRRMGLLERIAAASLPPRRTEFLDVQGRPLQRHVSAPARPSGAPGEEPGAEWEIERNALLDMLFDQVKEDVEFLFSDSITSVKETPGGLSVRFARAEPRQVSLLLGCDGIHSAVRRMWFGEESSFLYFMENYFSLTIVDRLLIPEDTSQMYSVPGRTVMLNAYHGKTDIAFSFYSETQIDGLRGDRERQRQLIRERFTDGGWRIAELLGEMSREDGFYFDQLCQIRMPSWSRGRVALVGDAGYCPSPAAGMGGSLALLGAAALADAMLKHPGDFTAGLEEYDRSLRSVVEQIQTDAVEFGLRMFMPRSAEELAHRNAVLGLVQSSPASR